jgi:hypothetical protein
MNLNKASVILFLCFAAITLGYTIYSMAYYSIDIRASHADINSKFSKMRTFFDDYYNQIQEYPQHTPSGQIKSATVAKRHITLRDSETTALLDPNSKNPTDPFSGFIVKKSIRYYSNGKTWYILVSNGPDRDIDFSAEIVNSMDEIHSATELYRWTYDSSNGLTSNGDILFKYTQE